MHRVSECTSTSFIFFVLTIYAHRRLHLPEEELDELETECTLIWAVTVVVVATGAVIASDGDDDDDDAGFFAGGDAAFEGLVLALAQHEVGVGRHVQVHGEGEPLFCSI